MFELIELTTPFLFILPFLGLFLFNKIFSNKKHSPSPKTDASYPPKSYPIVGSLFAFIEHINDLADWLTTILNKSPALTFTFYMPFGRTQIFTANPANVEHMLKTRFAIYQKGGFFRSFTEDLLGRGIFIVDGPEWKSQRQIASHEFNTRSLKKFIEDVVDTELHDRLIPILSEAAKDGTVLDLQDILKRFGVDNICQIAFGYDPECLTASLPDVKFAVAYDQAVESIGERFNTIIPLEWKIKKYLNIGSEKKFKEANCRVREFARTVVRDKKKNLESLPADSETDLLSRFLRSGHQDEDLVIDIVISFILAGRDTTSSALTWFFWLLSKSHASLSESMCLHPPVQFDSKQVVVDDVLPDGTEVKKGTIMTYAPYAMGRSEKLWGEDWAEFKPERWLLRESDDCEWRYIPKDPYTYPVFQAGPRICLGKEMAYLQMKMIVASVLSRFKVIPAEEGFKPIPVPGLTKKVYIVSYELDWYASTG